MKTKYLFASALAALFLFTGCDSKSEIDESLIASSSKNKKVGGSYESKKFVLDSVNANSIEVSTKLNGLDFKDFKGKKVVLVDVFATWCPPCIEGIPVLKGLKEKYKDQFEIVSVLFEEGKTKEEITAFVKKHDITYPVAMGDTTMKFIKDLGDIQKVPELYLFTKDGTFSKKFVGETDKETFERYIDNALTK
ncbi:TlpA family protein disulfide reductase [Poseidonibacter lekithochrous]|uniref:TlpA family protein disulfide reductase n=1 Tax=Poseidonibacter lekithochrous TaxID=1904463 RepID=UPI0008FC6E77|nr:TlpA disulfide reductase family protein [Poseidonibacter lekithochrous]QKJ22709.1 protein disulfide reductase, TlpA family [Poseidonibacter lekithochrous]